MVFKNVKIDKKEGIATVTINRPDVLNALNKETLKELSNVVKDLDNQVKARYAYDALDRQVVKIAEGVESRYVYDGEEMIAEYADGILVCEYVCKGVRESERICVVKADGRVAYCVYDGSGDIVGSE